MTSRMTSIGYDPTTGTEHVVPSTEPHPGDHILSPICECEPALYGDLYVHNVIDELEDQP